MSLLKSLKTFFGSSDNNKKNKSIEEEAPINSKKANTDSKNKNSSIDKVTKERKKVEEKVSEAKEEIKEKTSKAKEKTSKTTEEIKEKVSEAKEKTSKAKEEIKEKTSKAKEQVSEAKEEIKEKVSEAKEQVSEAKEQVSEAKEEIKEKTSKAKEKVSKATEKKEDKKGDNMTLLEENLVIRSNNVNKEFTQLFVDAGIDSVEHCFQCGTCSGSCPSGRITPYKVRQLVRQCLMGLKDEVISDPTLWMCTTCYTCQERCPRSVKIVEIIKLARNEAVKAGFMAPAHRATGSFVIKTGHAVPINDATKILRKRVGLSELPPTTHSDPEALEEIRTIVKATGFDNLIGYNMETNELTE